MALWGMAFEGRDRNFFTKWPRCAQSFLKIARVPSFDIRYSVFAVRFSLFRVSSFEQTGRFWRPEAGLNTDLVVIEGLLQKGAKRNKPSRTLRGMA